MTLEMFPGGRIRSGSPMTLISPTGKLSFNRIAQIQFNLIKWGRVSIGYDKKTHQLVLAPCNDECYGSRKFNHQILNAEKRKTPYSVCFLSGLGFLRYFGIDFSVPYYYPVSKDGDNLVIDLGSGIKKTSTKPSQEQ